MGYVFEVYSWEQVASGKYEDVVKYEGGSEDKEEAFAKMEELKSKGAQCVTLIWR